MSREKLSKNFYKDEFECQCGCGFSDVSLELVAVLQEVRDYFKQPVRITSACRCEAHNKAVGGSVRSKHLEGIASDIQVEKVSPRAVQDFLEASYPDTYGLGRYKSFTHIDVRGTKGRW